MILVLAAKLAYHFYSLLKVNRFAERFVIESMSDYWSLAIVVHIDFNALQSVIKILKVSFYFRVTCKLITREVSIMRAIAKVIS